VLNEDWGFEGTLVTDWDDVGRIVWEQHICADYAPASFVAVRAGNDIATVEAMKMEIPVSSPASGRIKTLLVSVDEMVEEEQALMVIEI